MKALVCSVCASLLLFSCTQSTKKQVLNNSKLSHNRIDTTLMDLFYGMESHYSKDPNTRCVLDSIPDILKLEKRSIWGNEYDSLKYEASLCIYMDSDFPSIPIQEQVMYNLDSMLQPDFVEYCIGSISESLHDSLKECKSSEDVLNYCSSVFNYADTYSRVGDTDSFGTTSPFRVALVACRIYNDEDVATYIFESSVDYNGSCGCPSQAYYCTFDKKTGRRLGYDDFFVPESVDEINRILDLEHNRVFKQRYDDDFYEGRSIFSGKQDCAALVKEGVLFYYVPYSIGTGAEGQYNLILTPEMTAGLRK